MRDHRRHGVAQERGPVPAWTMRRRIEPGGLGRTQLVGLLLVLATAAFVALHGLSLATSRDNALRSLRTLLPALTDLDQVLAVHEADLQAVAADGPVPVPGLPMSVQVSADAVRSGAAQVRRDALEQMALIVYRDGPSAFYVPDARAGNAPGLFTQLWSVRRSLGFFTESAHDRLAAWRLLAGIVALALVVVLALQVDGRRRVVAVSSAVAAGSALALIGAMLGRAAVWVLTSGDDDITAGVVARSAHVAALTIVAVAVITAVTAMLLVLLSICVSRLVSASGKQAAANDLRPRRATRSEYWEEP
jgi:hypothetical protein